MPDHRYLSTPTAPASIEALLDELAERAARWADTVVPRPAPGTLIETRVADVIRTLDTERRVLVEALRSAVRIADAASDEWDRASGPPAPRAGKILLALAGHVPDYRADTRAIHDLLALYAPPAWRAGDHVVHEPSGETWTVAYVDTATGYLAWCGWPEGEAKIADCRLVKSCSDDEHVETLRRLATADAGRRTSLARLGLASLGLAIKAPAGADVDRDATIETAATARSIGPTMEATP